MKAPSDSTPSGALYESGAFELTDLGECSFLDGPRPTRHAPPRSLTGSIEACFSGSSLVDMPSCSDVESAPCTVPGANIKRRRGRRVPDRVRLATANRRTVPVDSDPETESAGSAQTVVAPRSPAKGAGSATPHGVPGVLNDVSGTNSDVSDPFDAALADFLGAGGTARDDHHGLEAIYGAVFDPDERAQEMTRKHVERITGSQAAVPSESTFGWDDHELDEPIDPEVVKRRVGTRQPVVPQAGILRRRVERRRPDSDSSEGA